MKAVRFSRFGRASDVAGLVDVPEPAVPGAGQVLLEVKVAPINPSDLLHFAGGYSNPAPLPSFAGGGVLGRILAIGPDVGSVAARDRVIAVNTEHSGWRARFVWTAAGLMPRPDADPIALALLAANPPPAARRHRDRCGHSRRATQAGGTGFMIVNLGGLRHDASAR